MDANILKEFEPLHATLKSCLNSFGAQVLSYSGNFGLDKEKQKHYRDYLNIENPKIEEKLKIAFLKLPETEIKKQHLFLQETYQGHSFLSQAFDFIEQELSEFFLLGQTNDHDSQSFKMYIQQDPELSASLCAILAEYYVCVLLLYPTVGSAYDLRGTIATHLSFVAQKYSLNIGEFNSHFLNITQSHMAIEPSQIPKLYGYLDFIRQDLSNHDDIYENLLKLGSAYIKENALIAKILEKDGVHFQLTSNWLFERPYCSIHAYMAVLKQLKITQNMKIFLNAQTYKLEKSDSFVSTAKSLALKECVDYVDMVLQKQKLEQLVPQIQENLDKKTIKKI